MKKSWTKEEEQFIVDNYLNKSCEEIGNILARTTKSVQHKFKELNLKRPKAKIGDIVNGWKKLILGSDPNAFADRPDLQRRLRDLK